MVGLHARMQQTTLRCLNCLFTINALYVTSITIKPLIYTIIKLTTID